MESFELDRTKFEHDYGGPSDLFQVRVWGWRKEISEDSMQATAECSPHQDFD